MFLAPKAETTVSEKHLIKIGNWGEGGNKTFKAGLLHPTCFLNTALFKVIIVGVVYRASKVHSLA